MPPTVETDLTKITTPQLSGGNNPIQLPDFPQTNPAEITAAIPTTESILADFNAPTAAQGTQNNLRYDIYKSLDILAGKDEATLKAEEAAGIPVQTKQLQELSNRFLALRNESLAIPLQIQEQFAGTGATEGGAEPIQTSKLRQNAIQSLSISAQAQALQGNIALAQQQVDRAIKLQFEPEERKLQFLKQAYEFNREDLEREDKKKADTMKIRIDAAERQLAEVKAQREGVENLIVRVAGFGAPQAIVDRMRGARTISEALSVAAPYMQDPAQIQALKSAALDYTLKGLQIKKANKEMGLLDKYGGLTPSQWLEEKKLQEKQITEQKGIQNKAKQSLREVDELETQVNTILNSGGLSTVVGPNIFSRGVARQKEGFFPSLFATGATLLTGGRLSGGIVPEATGSADDVVALTEQLLSQQFLDKLVQVKGEGATFGALTDREGNSLRSAANAIAGTKIESNGQVIGYDMSQKEFNRQMGIILGALQNTREEATDSIFSADEEAVFDELGSIEGVFNPATFYGVQR